MLAGFVCFVQRNKKKKKIKRNKNKKQTKIRTFGLLTWKFELFPILLRLLFIPFSCRTFSHNPKGEAATMLK